MSFISDYLNFVAVITCMAILNFCYLYIKDPSSFNNGGKKKKYIPNASLPEKEDTVTKIRSIYKMGLNEY